MLLCHKPNVYHDCIKPFGMDCVVAGHAHGGQIRFGSRGLYAPDQGFFPRYTKGIVDERMVITTGAGNPCRFPRLYNPCEVLKLTLT